MALATSAVLAFAIASSSVFSFVLIKYFDTKIRAISKPHDVPSQVVSGLCDKTCTYLLMGNDSRKGLSHWQQVEFGSPRTVPGQRSDTIMLVVVDGRRDKAVVLSFPRDLWEPIPHQGMGKITTAYEGGPYRVAEVVQRLTGIRIGHFMTVNLAGFEEVIRAIGGIPICTDRPLYDKLAGLNLPKGCQTLDPYKALAYVRARHICGDTIPDFSRITRQQQFLRAVMARVLRPSMLLHAPSLVPAVLKHLFVDPGLKRAGISEIVALVRKLQGISTGAVDFRTVPSVPAMIDSPQGQVSIVKLLPQAKLLFQRLRTGKPLGDIGLSELLGPAVIRVRVYDDSSRGKAQKVTDYLTRSGFDIQPVATGSLGQTQPVILYRPGAKAEAGVVHKFLGTLQVKQAPKDELEGIDVAVPIDSTYVGPGVVKQHHKRPGHPAC